MAFQDEKRTAWKTIEEVFGLTLNDVISGTPSSSTYLRGDGSWATAASGATLYSGTGAPSGGTGNNGDFYIDTAAYYIYGPKAGGVWPAGVSLVGPTGATGAAGSAGSTGATGAQGIQGERGIPGIDGEDGQNGFPGPAGATGPAGADGVAGVSGYTIRGEDGQDGENSYIPGPMGPQGPAGADGAGGGGSMARTFCMMGG